MRLYIELDTDGRFWVGDVMHDVAQHLRPVEPRFTSRINLPCQTHRPARIDTNAIS
jgi:hypothetical protein